MPLNIQFQSTSTERTGDSQRPFKHNHSKEHRARVEAIRKKVEKEFFDSELHSKETHLTERIDD